MSRLASLSTPSRSRSSLSPSPGSPSPSLQLIETTHHRLLRIVINEIKSLHRTWDDIVGVDGIKAGKGIIDESTTMDNLLQCAEDERPSIAVHLERLYEQRAALETVISKLNKLLAKLSLLVDQAEKIFFEAYRLQGTAWVVEEPLWLSWTMDHFDSRSVPGTAGGSDSYGLGNRSLREAYTVVNSAGPLITLHNSHLAVLTSLSRIMLNPETKFDDAKLTLERWRDLSMGGERYEGVREWEELVSLEMSGGGEDDSEVEEEKPTSGRKKKGRK